MKTEFQFPSEQAKKRWDDTHYDEDKYWGKFPREELPSGYKLPYWAIGNFKKHGRPVLSPNDRQWDSGVFSGGVHNGAIIIKDGMFYYIYRGEFPIPPDNKHSIGFKCNIGIAISTDGINFEKRYDLTPIFNDEEDKCFSFEDVSVVECDGKYYMYVNRWDWNDTANTDRCGVFLAVSDDLLHWEKKGIIFKGAKKMHRNGCVLQDRHNRAVKVNGKFIMYLSTVLYGFIAYSKDLINWESEEISQLWPGGECCFALADYDENNTENIILFTGGHHTGHFYAVGEVLINKQAPSSIVEFLPRPVLFSEDKYPWENGLSTDIEPYPISFFRDTIFFNGLTYHNGKWWVYYGGSEYYTCLATSADKGE